MKRNKILTNQSKVIIFCLVLFLAFSLFHERAYALPSLLNIGSFATGAISDIFLKVLLTIKDILVAGMMKLAATILSASLTLTQKITTQIFDSHSFVYVGWTTFRDLANLGFVLGIIVIAIATILRIKSYQAQSILWKLVVAALIVNFSLMIGGAIIKVSDVFSNSFLQDITLKQNIDHNDPVQVSDKTSMMIVQNSEIGTILTTTSTVMDVSSKSTQGDIQNIGDIINIFIQVLAAVFVSFVLLVLALMFLLRYFYISFLLILSPGAWLLWIFPSAYRFWRDWWTHFLKWVFFAPLMLLFVKLSMIMMSQSSNLGFSGLTNSASQSGGVHGFDAIMLTLMSGAILIGGLKISQSLGMAGSSFILKQSSKVSGKMSGWARSKTTQYAKRGSGAAAAAIGRGIGVEKIGARMSSFAGKIKVPGVGWVARETVGRAGKGLINAGASAEKRKAEPVFGKPPETFVEEYKKWDKNRQREAYAGLPREEQLGLLMAMQQQGRLDGDTIAAFGGIDEITRQADYLRQGGRTNIANNLEKSLGMSTEMMKSLKEGNYEEYQKKAEEFYGKFSPEDWRAMAGNVGNEAFSGKPEILGLNKDASDRFRENYLANMGGRQGRGIGATASKLNDENMAKMFSQLLQNARGNLGQIDEEQEVVREINRPAGFAQTVKEKKTTMEKTTKNLDAEFEAALSGGQYDKAVEILKSSKNPKMKQLADNLGRGMGSIMGGMTTNTETLSSAKSEVKK